MLNKESDKQEHGESAVLTYEINLKKVLEEGKQLQKVGLFEDSCNKRDTEKEQ